MARAWTCSAKPERHGSFLQDGLAALSEKYGALQPSDRFACPICIAKGKSGWMRPATIPEASRIGRQLQEA